MNVIKVMAYCDGLCEPLNGQLGQGPMDIGYWAHVGETVLFTKHELVRSETNNVITGTCNQAEYYGLLRVHKAIVNWAKENNHEMDRLDVHIHSDSQIMVHQLDGLPYRAQGIKPWKVRDNGLKALVHCATQLQKILPYTLHKIDRKDNEMADSLAQSRVLKYTSLGKQIDDPRFLVKQHTPCADFIRGKSPYILLSSEFPDIKEKLIRAIQDRFPWEEIAHLFQQLLKVIDELQAKLPSINDQVDHWLKSTFNILDGDMKLMQEAIDKKCYDACHEEIVTYFEAFKKPLYTDMGDTQSSDDLSSINENWFCPRKQNKYKKQSFTDVPEFEKFEDSRQGAYEYDAADDEGFDFDGIFDPQN